MLQTCSDEFSNVDGQKKGCCKRILTIYRSNEKHVYVQATLRAHTSQNMGLRGCLEQIRFSTRLHNQATARNLYSTKHRNTFFLHQKGVTKTVLRSYFESSK
jgi:hypothetical protein